MTGLIKFLIYFWMCLGGAMAGVGIYFLVTGYERDGLTFLAFGAISAVMVWMNKKRLKVYGQKQQQGKK